MTGGAVGRPASQDRVSEDRVSPDRAAPIVPDAVRRPTLMLLPLIATVFVGMLTVGIPLPTIPVWVHHDLGFGTVTAGFAVGIQSLATLATRQPAGTIADTRGPKLSALLGLIAAALAGFTYVLATLPGLSPGGALAVLIVGRLILGCGESLLLTGVLAWGIGRVGPRNAGKVISWNGVAMYGALAAGAPIGMALLGRFGFRAVALAVTLLPLLALGVALAVPAVSTPGGRRLAFVRVLGAIWQEGLGLALATIGYAALAAFISLDYAAHGWSGAGLALTVFGIGFIAPRLVFSGLADRVGAAPIALVSLAVETAGQLVLAAAGRPAVALAGAFGTGLGFSLVFPALGVQAVRRVPAQNRGAALGGFSAFLDVAIAVTGPLTGAIAARFGYPAIFLAGAAAAAACMALVAATRAAQDRRDGTPSG
ncbi:MAG TPA: MFS transporter [Acetobacteraceae bacterium]|nr:MFS transporter [Acetobacteraceae bacterium]